MHSIHTYIHTHSRLVGSTVFLEPSGIQFRKYVTVRLLYFGKPVSGILPGPSEARLSIHKLVNSSNASSWDERDSMFDDQTYLVHGQTWSFSIYGVLQVQTPFSRSKSSGIDAFPGNQRTAIIIGVIAGLVVLLALASIYVYSSVCCPSFKRKEHVSLCAMQTRRVRSLHAP